jgi:hypothetical protein
MSYFLSASFLHVRVIVYNLLGTLTVAFSSRFRRFRFCFRPGVHVENESNGTTSECEIQCNRSHGEVVAGTVRRDLRASAAGCSP